MANNSLKFTIFGEDKSGKSVESFRKNVDKADTAIQGSITNIARWGGAAVIAAGAIAAASVSVASTFETNMTNVSTLLDTNVESMEAMKDQVLDISKNTPVALNELTTALYDVRSAGISAEDSMLVLERSAQLAVSGLGSTKEAVDLSTSAINSFGLTGDSANEAFDIMMLTVKSGKTNVAELAQSFGKVAGVAKTAGVGFDELQASTAALTTTGQSASDAQTQIRSAILAIQAPTGDMAKMYKKMGTESGTALIKQKGLVGAMNDIKKAAGGDVEILKKAFGSVEALGATLSLTGEQGDAFNTILADMKNPAGALSDAFAKQEKTLSASWQILKNNVSVIMVKIGSVIIPAVVKAVKGLTTIFQNLMEYLENSGALDFLGEKLLLIGEISRNVFNNYVVPAFNLAIDVIKLIGGAISQLKIIWDGLVDAFLGSEVIQLAISKIRDGFSKFAGDGKTLKESIVTAFKFITESVKVFAEWFNAFVTPIIVGVVESIIIILGLLYAAWDSNFLGIKDITIAVFTGIKGIIEASLTIISGILDVFVGLFTGDWERMAEGITNIWLGMADGLESILKMFFDSAWALGESFGDGLYNIITGSLEAIRTWWDSYWSELGNSLVIVLGALSSTLELGMNSAKSIWENALTNMKNFFVSIWNSILNTLETKINSAIDILNKLIQSINRIPGVSVPIISHVSLGGGGEAVGAAQGALPRRAFGGSVAQDRSYLVGENGPEVFTPGTSGNISSSGGNKIEVNINITGNNIDSDDRMMAFADEIFERFTRSAELKQLGL